MKKTNGIFLMAIAAMLVLPGCTGKGNTGADLPDSGGKEKLQKEAEVLRYEAEEAGLSGKVRAETGRQGYTGAGYVEGIEGEGDACTFEAEIETAGFYDLNFVSASLGGYKENNVLLDGVQIGVVSVENSEFTNSVLERVYLEAGLHEITLAKAWGWIALDSLILTSSEELDSSLYEIPPVLVNPNADENARRLMSYLTAIYGKKILSGQYCDGGLNGLENQAIYRTTGKHPAVLGLDLIECSPSREANGSVSHATELALEADKAGAVITLCWHWNPPEKYLTDLWWKGFYTEATNIDLKAIMNGEDEEGRRLLLEDIDRIADELKIMSDAGIPLLWRPLHEASGGWFWWGAAGAEPYKELWVLLYDRLTTYHGLNNLIWVWNGQAPEWYPGDEFVDVIGEDIYPGERVYGAQTDRFLAATKYTRTPKLIVLSENGCVFDPDLAFRDGAAWGFFATWGGEFVLKNEKLNRYSEKYTEEYMLKKVYEDERIVTLEDLPDLKTYPAHD